MEQLSDFRGSDGFWERVLGRRSPPPGSAALRPREEKRSAALRHGFSFDQSFSLPGLMPKVSEKARWKAE